MRFLKVFLFFLAILFWARAMSSTASFKNETLKYKISYKWGLIHKDSGEATLTLRQKGNNYDIVLTAKTLPWADKLYKVRDTLKTTMEVGSLKPLRYEKLTHEKGKYKKDEIRYENSGNITTGYTKRYREKKGKMTVTENKFSSSGPVFDMLSIFYYIRSLNFSEMGQNKTYTATIFSGKSKETIKIKNLGIEKIKLNDKTEREAYHIRFNFTKEGGAKSSNDMDTWISTGSEHIPLYLVGKLPIGEVRASLI